MTRDAASRASRLITLPLLLLFGAPVSSALADSMLVPAKTQAAILTKMLAYDKALQSKPGVKFLLIGSERDPGLAEELVGAFKALGVIVIATKTDELAGKANDSTIVYMMTGIASTVVKRLCAERRVLSVSGYPGLAENGDVSVAIGLRPDGKPQIVVHLGRLEAEGHQFSPDLLKLAKIVH